MMYAALLIAISTLASTAAAQVQARAHRSPWVYDPYVRQLGAAHFPGGGAGREDEISVVRVLPSGSVLVAGSTYGSLGEAHAGTGTTSDIFLARFGPLGDLEWIAQVGAVTGPSIPTRNGNPSGPGGDATQGDAATDIAVAADGSIFLTGATGGSLGETNAGSADLILAKFDASGSLQWLHQIGVETAATIVPAPGATQFGDASHADAGSSIIPHSSGGVTLGGTTWSNLSEQNSSGTFDFLLVRYDASGGLQWVRQMSAVSAPMIGFNPGSYDYLAGIASHPSGSIVLAGTRWAVTGGTLVTDRPVVMTFDDAGHPLAWSALGSVSRNRLQALAIEGSSGRILVGGYSYVYVDSFPGPTDAFAASLDASLNLQWISIINPSSTAQLGLQDLTQNDAVTGMGLDAAGNLVLCGTTAGSMNELNAGSSDIFTAKMRGTDGAILWVSQIGQTTAAALGLDASGGETLGGHGLALGPAGTISLGGSTSGSFAETSAGARDALLLRLDSQGRLH